MAAANRLSKFRRVSRIVWNADERRVRAPWSIVAVTALVLVVPGLVVAAVVRPLELPLSLRGLAANGTYAGFTALVLVVWARYVDRRPVAAYGFDLDRTWARGLALGALVGLVGWGGALATDLAFGWARVDAVLSPGAGDIEPAAAFAAFALQWALVAFWEETLFRGLVMRNAIEGLSHPRIPRGVAIGGGLVGSSALFGALHAGQANSVLALGFWVLAGLVLGLAYLLTGRLAVPIGLHFAFDFAANNVFGLVNVRPVGAEVPTLVRPAFSGPERLVGIAGAVNTAWLLAIAAMVVAVARHRGPFRIGVARGTRGRRATDE